MSLEADRSQITTRQQARSKTCWIRIGLDIIRSKEMSHLRKALTNTNTVMKTRWKKVAFHKSLKKKQTKVIASITKIIHPTNTSILATKHRIQPAAAKRLHPKKSLRDLRKKSAASLRQATSITVAMLCTKVKVVKPKHLKDKQANGKADKMRLKKRKMM